MPNKKKPIPLFFWSERKFIFKDKENYGDLLSKYLVEKISGRPVKWVHPKKQPWFKWDKTNFLAIGSIIHHASKDSIVWGSGIIDREQKIANADFRAVRGPQTRKVLLELGYECPEVYGDPALLLPRYFNPEVKKIYKLGIVPHYHDYKEVLEYYKDDPDINVIDLMTMDVEDVTRQILECEKTISSSLHGLIVSHAYGIPSVWVEFSKKLYGNGVKFQDYFESVGLFPSSWTGEKKPEFPISSEKKFIRGNPFHGTNGDFSKYEPVDITGKGEEKDLYKRNYYPQLLQERQDLKVLEALFKEYPIIPDTRKISELQKGLLRIFPFYSQSNKESRQRTGG